MNEGLTMRLNGRTQTRPGRRERNNVLSRAPGAIAFSVHGRSKRWLGVSQPRYAQCKNSQTYIERHTEPEPCRVAGTLHAADAAKYCSSADSVKA
jgi:hypothetical protein